nr:glycoside hydrolase family 9 protein [Streptomyces hoynatensis]
MAATAGAGPAVAAGPELISNGDFSSGSTTPWWWTENVPSSVVDGRLCTDVPGGTTNFWDAIIGYNDIPLTAGETYQLTYTATASIPVTIQNNVQLNVDPYTPELSSADQITDVAEPITHVFTAGTDLDAAQLVFQIGGSDDPYTFCLDDVSLTGGAEQPPYDPDTGSPVRVNQVGYLTEGPKQGTFVTEETGARDWTLNAADGSEVAGGTTTPLGVDPSSGQNVQGFDFSEVTEPGDGYTVTIDGETSEPFSIGDDLYDDLVDDSLSFFYQQRSGIEIDADLVGEEYARPAGHANVAPNQGDDNVPCQEGVCDYTLDAAGGWYDAGDQGKYVVNGGISVAQLMSEYERTLTAENAAGEQLADGELAVPEQGNGTPDILDEARWELEFLLSMQVPAGEELAGMVHHKLHDAQWTGLPQLPNEDSQPRELHPPSTAATLNLAAAAAQGARLFEPYDPDFAAQALDAAETAYAAALAHPDILAPASDATGGGAYNDADVTDEFYWAAAELFITTGEDSYRQDVLGSPLSGDTEAIFPSGGFSWGSTAALGQLDLASVPNDLTADQLAAVRGTVTDAADALVDAADSAAYGLPFGTASADYFWGSNSGVLNNMIVLATASDLTGESAYRDAVLTGLDYILGRNPLNHSYVTGWGERASENQHHRFWAHQLDPDLPHPPDGSLSGGPDSALQDPTAEAELQGCVGAMCYIDDIQSYSTNEVAINWNAPLAWIAGYVAGLGTDDGDPGDPDPAACEVNYVSYRWSGGFTSQVEVRNTGDTAISPWELKWSFADQQRITNAWNATVTQSGSDVSAKPLGWNATIPPGGSVSFGFNGTSSGSVSDPAGFTLNGGACTS